MDQGETRLLLCPSCGARNRVPVERTQTPAKCGRCHAPLPTGNQDGPGFTYVIRCGECRTKNRVHASKLADPSKCGKCGAKLATHELLEPQPVQISDYNFPEKVLKSPLPVMVFAMSPSCPGCGMAAPHVDAFARESKGRVRVGRLNIQSSPGLAAKFDILSVPYLLIFDKGELLRSLPGGLNKRQLQDLMLPYLY
jgi:thioredoxin 2